MSLLGSAHRDGLRKIEDCESPVISASTLDSQVKCCQNASYRSPYWLGLPMHKLTIRAVANLSHLAVSRAVPQTHCKWVPAKIPVAGGQMGQCNPAPVPYGWTRYGAEIVLQGSCGNSCGQGVQTATALCLQRSNLAYLVHLTSRVAFHLYGLYLAQERCAPRRHQQR